MILMLWEMETTKQRAKVRENWPQSEVVLLQHDIEILCKYTQNPNQQFEKYFIMLNINVIKCIRV